MKELYQRLYDDANVEYKYCKKRVGLSELSHFVAMKGNKFDQDAIRLFVVGRAVNGWGAFPCESAQDFAKAAEESFCSDGFQWIKTDRDSLYSEYINEKTGKLETYFLSRSPFWRTTEIVWRGLSGSNDYRFFEHTAESVSALSILMVRPLRAELRITFIRAMMTLKLKASSLIARRGSLRASLLSSGKEISNQLRSAD